jgi:hypothetical protein
VRSSCNGASGPAAYRRVVLPLRMSNDMDSRGHVDGDVAAVFAMLGGFGGALSHCLQLQLPAGEGGLAVR